MKTNWLHKIFLFLAVIAFLFSFLMSWTKKQQTNRLNIRQFEKVLYSKEIQTKKLLNLLEKKISVHEFKQSNNVIFFEDIDFSLWSDKDIYVVVYQYDSLRLWTDNHLALPDIIDDRFDLNINKIGNSWYEIKRIKFSSYDIIGLIKIKDEFPYQNKYLQDKFAKGLDFIPGSVRISLIPVSYGFDVKTHNGQYLFSLVPITPSSTHSDNRPWQLVFFFIGIWFFLVYLAFVLYKKGTIYSIIVLIALFIVRVLMLANNIPLFLYDHSLFSPVLGFYSIGDLFIDVPIFIFFLYVLFIKFDYPRLRPEQNYNLFDVVVVILVNLLIVSLLFFSYDFLYSIIIKTSYNFKLYNIISLSLESWLIILHFGLIFISILLFYHQLVRSLLKYFSFSLFIVILFLSVVIVFGLSLFVSPYTGSIYKLLFIFPLLGIVLFKNKEIKFDLLIFIGFFAALIFVVVILVGLDARMKNELKVKSQTIDFFRDDVTEQLLGRISNKLASDEVLNSYLSHQWNRDLKSKLLDYLNLEYLGGYLKKYSININICGKGIAFEGENDYQVCMDKYSSIVENKGIPIAKYVYFVNQLGFLPEYIIFYSINDRVLIIELVPTAIENRIGYPDLLLKQDNKNDDKDVDFQYAVYKGGRLVYKTGSFIYPRSDEMWRQWLQKENFVKWNGYKHYISWDTKNDYLIIVSYKAIAFYDFIISLAYLFVIFVLLLTILFGIYHLSIGQPTFTFRTKIIVFTIGILTMAFILSGILTAVISVQNYKTKFYNQIKQTLSRSRYTIEQINISRQDNFLLKYNIKNLASILNIDINLYDSNGKLISTSREAIFDNYLLGKYMNYNALYNLVNEKFIEYIDKEAIGRLSYNSAYTIITNADKKVVGFINIPYFANPQELRKEVLDLLVTLANIYILMFIIAVVLAYALSAQIISPLKELQDKLKHLKVGHKYEKIEYKRKDEIGALVEEYNNMVDKLQESIQLLAKSERESAWRDMAKQVAHEIKNPLTPMKLSIQLLQKSWENKDENFGERLKEVTQTLIEQIENLRNIAEEFSNFAKMPKSENEKIDLAQKIENLVKLYESLQNVDVQAIIKDKPVFIWADNKQISRALINLIKNAIQAIPEGVKGKVTIELDRLEDKALIKVIDNGTGIPEEIREKLFTPSFTTKSSGMGLGLSMVKNIVQNARGKIWFDTEIGKGTTFYIEFPIYQAKNS